MVSNHSINAVLPWTTFKDRLGISECHSLLFDISELISIVDLPEMDSLFTKEEIDQAIKDMPSDHAPRPDGFIGLFMKRCWNIIKEDFYGLCDQFWQGTIDLTNLNGSYIARIPNNDNPSPLNDFRPISLLNTH